MGTNYPSGWQTPKTDWSPVDGVVDTDMNRVEANVLRLGNESKEGECYFKLNGTIGGSNPGLMRWKRVFDQITIFLPKFTDTSNSFSVTMFPTTVDLGVTGDEEWPLEILAKDHGNYPVKANLICIDDGDLYPGLIELPRLVTSSLVLYIITPTSGQMQSNVWANSGLKGFDAQNITYIGNDL